MTRGTAENRNMCPYWAMQAMKCELYREGLFLPLNDHIEVYCTTFHYPQCLQYTLYSSSQPTEKNSPDRRKYERVVVFHRVTLVKLLRSEDIASHVAATQVPATTAGTLDLSKGGMRLAIEQPLAKTTFIRFSFEESFPKSVQTGEGQIAWCNKQSNEFGYQAGISFQDDRLIDTMGLYLGLLTSIPPSAG